MLKPRMQNQSRKQYLFIYERKEILTLSLLGILIALFAFTLGVHLGKRVKSSIEEKTMASELIIPTVEDSIPSHQQLSDQNPAVPQSLDESAFKKLQEEVKQKKIKLDIPRQIDLPTKPRSKNAGATQPEHHHE